uniref:Uncharacterized protein n=1 Tax=Anguilla anguilla TaxID=7936 RepID=A0A0E9TB47_ANGAN
MPVSSNLPSKLLSLVMALTFINLQQALWVRTFHKNAFEALTARIYI